MTITKDSIIGDILDAYGEVTAPFFLEMGMHCLGCPASRGETVAQACDVHGVDADELVKKLNEAVGADTLAKTCGGGRNGA
jgi:hybrid cluster-associated redox disulfide protein